METFAEKGLSTRKQICKLVLVSAVLSIMLLLSVSSLKNYGTGIYNRENYDNQKNIAESIDATYMRLMENVENARNNYYTFLEGNARMTAAVLRSFAANEEYNGHTIWTEVSSSITKMASTWHRMASTSI